MHAVLLLSTLCVHTLKSQMLQFRADFKLYRVLQNHGGRYHSAQPILLTALGRHKVNICTLNLKALMPITFSSPNA